MTLLSQALWVGDASLFLFFLLSPPFFAPSFILFFSILSSLLQFVRECEARLVGDYRVDYLYSHTKVMVQEERRRDLSNLFVLLSGIPHALEPVILEFEDHVKCQGKLVDFTCFYSCTLTFVP